MDDPLNKTALFVGAHPDYIEIGAGGTAARLVRDGWDVWFFVRADGARPSTSPEEPANNEQHSNTQQAVNFLQSRLNEQMRPAARLFARVPARKIA